MRRFDKFQESLHGGCMVGLRISAGDEQDSFLGLDERTGIAVIEDVLDENGTTLKNTIPRFWASAYLLDEECPTASLLIVDHDAKSRNAPGDMVSVTFSMFQPQPMAPPTEHTPTIDGPGVTDIGPGEVVGIVSDPPAAGPVGGSGALCVAVTVHSGAGSSPFFPQVSPRIQLFDPFTDTVLKQLSGLDTLMSPNSTRTFNLGPYTHDPWTALAVTVQPDLGDVLGSAAFPTSC